MEAVLDAHNGLGVLLPATAGITNPWTTEGIVQRQRRVIHFIIIVISIVFHGSFYECYWQPQTSFLEFFAFGSN